MRCTQRSLGLLLGALLTSFGCSGEDSQPGDPDGGVPDSGVDPFADNGVFLNVLPPGSADANTGNLDADPNSTNQLVMYENLVFSDDYPIPGELRDGDLVPRYFKDGPLRDETSFDSLRNVTDGTRAARIGRDEMGVPHIFGEARSDVLFGTGYATATDRMFAIDVLRHVGRGRMSDFLGPAGGNYSQDRELGRFGGYDEQEIQSQIDQLAPRFGTDGVQAQQDIEDFVSGINQYIDEIQSAVEGAESVPIEYSVLGLELRPFTARDVLAIAALVQSTFATGGGGEHRQLQLLHGLAALFPGDPQAACETWRDIRQANDPERPNTTDLTFETQSPPTIDESACPLQEGFATQYPGAVLFDEGSVEELELLTIEDCVAPETATPTDIECPELGQDVVDESVPSANAMMIFRTTSKQESQLASGIPYRLGEPSTDALRDGGARARATLDGVRLALNQDSFPDLMSNAILVSPEETEDGHSIAVFGPQTGYFSPQILVEFSQQGGGIHSRGMAFAGLPYVIIGRGIDHAWSATSSGDDITDIRVLRLCEPGGGEPTRASTSYLYNGVCTPMLQRTDVWTAETNLTTVGKPSQRVTRNILRAPDYGPVFATATVGGAPVALAVQRSTFFGEVDSVRPFLAATRNDMVDPDAFFEVFNSLTGTFNWFYVDASNIAYFNSGLLPVRATGIHPDLPQWGTGEFDWQQTGTGRINPEFSFDNFLPLSNHPHEANPSRGYFANWNNAQAPGFYANDTQTGYGRVYRSELLSRRLDAFRAQSGTPLHTRASMVQIMIDAGTTDLRGQEILPRVFEVLGDVGDLSSFEQEVVQLMKHWVANGPNGLGSMRRDRSGPGLDVARLEYEDRAAVAFMDRWWDRMIDALLPQIKDIEDAGVMIGGRHNAPGAIGSAFQGGYYGYVLRVLEMALAQSAAPYRRIACAGTGEPADCRAALVVSLRDTIADLGLEMAQWDPTLEADDAINHTALGLADPPDIHWQNRPTWQQVVQPTQDVLR
ncbi:MAG: penicillin acylase family protein [Polyangiales bacterium]